MCSFFFNDTATTEIYTLSLHDALPISVLGVLTKIDKLSRAHRKPAGMALRQALGLGRSTFLVSGQSGEGLDELWRALLKLVERSEEHTSELQSRQYLVCRLLLEKKKIL